VERPYLAGIFARYPGVERILRCHIHRFLQRRFGGTVPAAARTTAIALHLQDNAEPASSLAPRRCCFSIGGGLAFSRTLCRLDRFRRRSPSSDKRIGGPEGLGKAPLGGFTISDQRFECGQRRALARAALRSSTT